MALRRNAIATVIHCVSARQLSCRDETARRHKTESLFHYPAGKKKINGNKRIMSLFAQAKQKEKKNFDYFLKKLFAVCSRAPAGQETQIHNSEYHRNVRKIRETIKTTLLLNMLEKHKQFCEKCNIIMHARKILDTL